MLGVMGESPAVGLDRRAGWGAAAKLPEGPHPRPLQGLATLSGLSILGASPSSGTGLSDAEGTDVIH